MSKARMPLRRPERPVQDHGVKAGLKDSHGVCMVKRTAEGLRLGLSSLIIVDGVQFIKKSKTQRKQIRRRNLTILFQKVIAKQSLRHTG